MKFAKKQGIHSDLKDKGPGRTDWTPKDLDVPEKMYNVTKNGVTTNWGFRAPTSKPQITSTRHIEGVCRKKVLKGKGEEVREGNTCTSWFSNDQYYHHSYFFSIGELVVRRVIQLRYTKSNHELWLAPFRYQVSLPRRGFKWQGMTS